MNHLATRPKTIPIEVFSDNLQRICGSFEDEHDGATVAGATSCMSRSGLDLASVTQNASAIRRLRHHIKSDPGNHFFLVLQKEGVAWMEQDDTLAELQPGDMFLVDSSVPSIFRYQGRLSHQLSLHLPRKETVQRFGRRVHGGMAINKTDPLAQAMQAILAALAEGEQPQQSHVTEAFYGVLGAYLFNRSNGEVGKPNPDRQILNRALAVMTQHYTDPDFASVHIANLTGVSLRKLQRVFSSFECSPHKRLQDVRLRAAHDSIVAKAALTPGDVSAIAFACGYSDLSTFHRQFKARFGCNPTGWHAMQ